MGSGGIGFCQGLVWMCSLVSRVNLHDPCLTEGQAWPLHVYKPKTLGGFRCLLTRALT